MAGRVLYLDVDDEITSAAARIRTAEGTRVAVVLPYGSRVATSRINFRLLARDATTNGKRLAVVAGDAATRALAASAGLPIFATVGEYESSIEAGSPAAAAGSAGVAGAVATDAAGAAGAGPPSGAGPAGVGAATGAAGGAGPGKAGSTGPNATALTADEPMLVSETVATPKPRSPGESGAGAAAAAGLGAAAVTAGPGAAALPSSTGGTGSPAPSVAPSMGPTAASGEARRAARTPAAIPAARVVADTPATPAGERDLGGTPRMVPVGRGVRVSVGRTPLLLGFGVLVLAIAVVGGVGAFLFLPTATAVVTPREATLGPTALRIQASTTATEPDPERLIVPARTLTIPVEAADSFPATGKRIEEDQAHGAVRFDNLDPTSSNGIPKGSIVSTGSGIRFRTDKAVTVPPAELVGLTIVPSHASVNVTAVDAGPEGNVEPNAIRTVPRGEEPFFLKVTNPEATSGGRRTEFPRVTQEDVDKATAALTDQLSAAFEERLDDPNLPGDAATVFPETKTLDPPVFGVDPATLVGQEVETFELGATGSGTVVAVDTSPVQAVAEATIESSVTPGYALVDGSSQVVPAPAVVSDGTITFPVVATARQVLVLDPDAIEREIMGKPLDQAREILAAYGDAQLTVWPDWVGTVPTLESRVEVTTAEPEGSP